MMWCYMVVLLAVIHHSFTVNPGIKVCLTEKGLQYASHVEAGFLQQKLEKASFPDTEGDIRLSILGHVHYYLMGMSVVKCNFPEPTLSFSEGAGIFASVNGFNIAIQGSWKTHYGVIWDGGSFTMALYNIDISVLVQMGSDEQGHLNVSSSQCKASVGDIDVQFHGGGSFIFEPFVKYFKGHISVEVQQKICPMIQQNMDELESQFAAMNVSIQVNKHLLIDIPLVVPPVVQTKDMEMDFKGEFYSPEGPVEPPFSALPFMLPMQEELMVTLGVSDFVINSAFYAYYSSGFLKGNITDEMIHKISPFHLNTTSFMSFMPQLPKELQNLLMLFETYATNTPMLTFLPDNTTLYLSGSTKAYAIEPNSTLIPLFRLDMNISFDGKFSLTEEALMGKLDLNKFVLVLGASEVGSIQTASLQSLLQIGIQKFILPQVNDLLQAGISLPLLPNIKLSKPTLKVNQGFLAIATDAQVISPKNEE